MKDSVFFIFDQDAYYASQNSGSSGRDGDSTTTPPKKYLIPTAGVEKQSEDGRYSANGYNVYCNLDALTATLKRVFETRRFRDSLRHPTENRIRICFTLY